ncbi:MAG: phage Gp37/Gp68 family protein [Methyloversatilis sp.]|nr:phage Gp37/Gp68 family protein [Methyloversatilis sp.]
MAERSNIEWCDATFNPWIGCTKVSPACDHCYAERDFDLRRHVVQWGAGQARKRTGDDNWKKPGRWNKQRFVTCGCGFRGTIDELTTDAVHGCNLQFKPARRRVFCASLADVFDNEVPIEWLVDLFDLIRRCKNLDFLLLTKRVGNWRNRIDAAIKFIESDTKAWGDNQLLQTRMWLYGWQSKFSQGPRNVWLGATICNQDEADRDIPKLLAVPAAVRFLSIEPMLGPVDLTDIVVRHGGGTEDHFSALYDADDDEADTASYIDWVICGGESGPHARPMHPDWARNLRDQCAAAGVPFLFKQWGEWGTIPGHGAHYPAGIAPDGSWVGAEDQFTEDCALMYRIGKKAAGRVLDGRTHDGFPETRS